MAKKPSKEQIEQQRIDRALHEMKLRGMPEGPVRSSGKAKKIPPRPIGEKKTKLTNDLVL